MALNLYLSWHVCHRELGATGLCHKWKVIFGMSWRMRWGDAGGWTCVSCQVLILGKVSVNLLCC